jgi:hypothetical protein
LGEDDALLRRPSGHDTRTVFVAAERDAADRRFGLLFDSSFRFGSTVPMRECKVTGRDRLFQREPQITELADTIE